MSLCITAACPHGRGVFVWLGDGPEDDGTYPWVHDTSTSPGHLHVCDAMPFATAAEAGEVCACGHESGRHPASGPVRPSPVSSRADPCLDCPCGSFRHRPEDLARARADPAPAAADAPVQADMEQLALFAVAVTTVGESRARQAAHRETVTVRVTGGVL